MYSLKSSWKSPYANLHIQFVTMIICISKKYFLKTLEALVVRSQEADTKERVMDGIPLIYYL